MRVHHVKRARKDQGKCRTCGGEILRGHAYKWIKFRYGSKQVKCVNCNFRPSELTQGKMSQVYAAQENVEDFLVQWEGDLDDLTGEVESAIDEVRDVAEEYRESADSQRAHFPDSEVADECEEKADELDDWVGTLENLSLEPFEGERNDDDEPVDPDEFTEWMEAIKETVETAFGECPL